MLNQRDAVPGTHGSLDEVPGYAAVAPACKAKRTNGLMRGDASILRPLMLALSHERAMRAIYWPHDTVLQRPGWCSRNLLQGGHRRRAANQLVKVPNGLLGNLGYQAQQVSHLQDSVGFAVPLHKAGDALVGLKGEANQQCQWHRTFPHFGPTNFPHPCEPGSQPDQEAWDSFLGRPGLRLMAGGMAGSASGWRGRMCSGISAACSRSR